MLSRVLPIFASVFAAPAWAQTAVHYWDFSAPNDLAGGLTTVAVGAPDLSIHPVYGEAYPGAGPSLNSIRQGLSAGGGFLEADVYDGGPTALQFYRNRFAFSAWVYDEDEGDARAARVFDFHTSQSGVELASSQQGVHSVRVECTDGFAVVTDSAGAVLPMDQWVHVAVNVDRITNRIEVYFDGVSVADVDASILTGNIEPSTDLEIGVRNGGDNAFDSQDSAVDDLAFYDKVLSDADIAGLASGVLTPRDFMASAFPLRCDPASAHGGGVPVTLAGSFFASPGALHLDARDGPAGEFGYFLVSATLNDPGVGVSNGWLCLGPPIGRYAPAAGGVLVSTGQFDGAGVLQNIAGTSAFGSGYDVPSSLPSPPGGMLLAGDTWYFQCWYRDGLRSNFSNVVEVTF